MFYGKNETIRDQNKKKVGQEFKANGHLFFDFRKIRQEDFEHYQTSEKRIDLKVETYFVPALYNDEIMESHKIKIDNDLYNVTAIDPSTDRFTMFWYLSKLGR